MIQRFNKNGTIEATEFIESSAPFYLNKDGSIACQEFIEQQNLFKFGTPYNDYQSHLVNGMTMWLEDSNSFQKLYFSGTNNTAFQSHELTLGLNISIPFNGKASFQMLGSFKLFNVGATITFTFTNPDTTELEDYFTLDKDTRAKENIVKKGRIMKVYFYLPAGVNLENTEAWLAPFALNDNGTFCFNKDYTINCKEIKEV